MCPLLGMSQTFLPNDQYMLIHWSELETAWRMLAAPEKQSQIEATLTAVQALNSGAGPEKAVYTMIAATAWLTDDGYGSIDG